MNHYASMLQNGDGIPVNKKEATYYYKLSEDKGNINTMINYAKMLENGEGINSNKEEADHYYKMYSENTNSK